eukprot:m.53411 g.53411  ORF g.53411 m.53411 type:complete len:400 (+) comp7457_c0_seq1:179-1378(+)
MTVSPHPGGTIPPRGHGTRMRPVRNRPVTLATDKSPVVKHPRSSGKDAGKHASEPDLQAWASQCKKDHERYLDEVRRIEEEHEAAAEAARQNTLGRHGFGVFRHKHPRATAKSKALHEAVHRKVSNGVPPSHHTAVDASTHKSCKKMHQSDKPTPPTKHKQVHVKSSHTPLHKEHEHSAKPPTVEASQTHHANIAEPVVRYGHTAAHAKHDTHADIKPTASHSPKKSVPARQSSFKSCVNCGRRMKFAAPVCMHCDAINSTGGRSRASLNRMAFVKHGCHLHKGWTNGGSQRMNLPDWRTPPANDHLKPLPLDTTPTFLQQNTNPVTPVKRDKLFRPLDREHTWSGDPDGHLLIEDRGDLQHTVRTRASVFIKSLRSSVLPAVDRSDHPSNFATGPSQR